MNAPFPSVGDPKTDGCQLIEPTPSSEYLHIYIYLVLDVVFTLAIAILQHGVSSKVKIRKLWKQGDHLDFASPRENMYQLLTCEEVKFPTDRFAETSFYLHKQVYLEILVNSLHFQNIYMISRCFMSRVMNKNYKGCQKLSKTTTHPCALKLMVQSNVEEM